MIRAGLVQRDQGFGVYQSSYDKQNRHGPGAATHEERPYVVTAGRAPQEEYTDPIKPENITRTERSINYHDLFQKRPTDLTKQLSDILARTVGRSNPPGGGLSPGGSVGSGGSLGTTLSGLGGGGAVSTVPPPGGASGPSTQEPAVEEPDDQVVPQGGPVVEDITDTGPPQQTAQQLINLGNVVQVAQLTRQIVTGIIANPPRMTVIEGLLSASLHPSIAQPGIDLIRYLFDQQENFRRFVSDRAVRPGAMLIGNTASNIARNTATNIGRSVNQYLFNSNIDTTAGVEEGIRVVLRNTAGEHFNGLGSNAQNSILQIFMTALLFTAGMIVAPTETRQIAARHFRGQGGALRNIARINYTP
jgi:hypothetical protein